MAKICVITPTYNESKNLPYVVEMLEKVLQKEDFKIIIADDNSPDGTADMAEELNKRYKNIIVHRRPRKLGIGSAIRDGLRIALSFQDSKYLVTIDADLSHNPSDIPRLLSDAENADLVQGSRYIEGGKIIGWSFFRRTLSYTANLICRLLFKTHLHEHTTNFRVYSRRCAETIVMNVNHYGYEWQIGAILAAKDHNYKVKEIPITFVERAHGKTKLKSLDVFRCFSLIAKKFLSRSFSELSFQEGPRHLSQ